MADMTRIADLPDTGSAPPMNGYMPMNIHPNPYGHGEGQAPPPPENTKFGGQGGAVSYTVEPQRLPSRDIPQDTTLFSQDEGTRANYVPPAKPASYVEEWEDPAPPKRRPPTHLMDTLYIPMLLGVLYFIFQTGAVQRTLHATTQGLGVYRDDGHPNVQGRILHCVLFGAAAFAVMHGKDVLREIILST